MTPDRRGSQTRFEPKLRKSYLKTHTAGFILLFLVFIPRLLALDVFVTADEPLFLQQARDFATGLSSGDFSRTLGIGYPGVTVAWWAAPVVATASSEWGAYVAGRMMLVLLNGLLLITLYRLARSLLGRRPALLGVGLLALDPYSLAYSRLLHIEMPLALLMTLAGLAFLLWLHDPQRRWLLLTGLFTGLALLTKSTALLLGPMLLAMLIGWAVTANRQAVPKTVASPPPRLATSPPLSSPPRHLASSPPRLIASALLGKLPGLFLIALLAAALFFALWPAMWVDPAGALDLTFGKLLTDQEAGTGNYGMFWLGHFVQDPGPFFYPLTFLLKATPWLLLGLCLGVWQLRLFQENKGPKRPETGDRRPVSHLTRSPVSRPPSFFAAPRPTLYALRSTEYALPLWFFALTYLILMTIASKKSVRYLLPAFPTFYLLAGLALSRMSEWRIGEWRMSEWRISEWRIGEWRMANERISEWPRSVANKRILRFLPLRLIASSLLLLFTLLYQPYYFTYYNPLLLGWRWAPQTLLVGWGEGLDEAGRYLNEQPSGVAAAWYEWLFPLYYQGETQPANVDNLLSADHAVLYINQVQRDVPNPNIIRYFRTRRKAEYTVRLAGVDYAWVYPGPVIGYRADPTPQYPLGGEFGGEVRLLGYDLVQPPLSGQPLVVTLYWRVLATPPAERFVYIRLVDAQGHVWARADSPPVIGSWPASRWQPEMLLEDAQELPIPAGTPPGAYRLEVGWYDPANGQTLSASGQPLGQGGGLLLGQLQLGWQALAVNSDLPHQTDLSLAPNAHLVGYDLPPASATSGDVLPIHLAWREAASLFSFTAMPNDFVLFQWQQVGQTAAEQLDALPLPIEEWGRQALLLSQHDVIVPPTLAAGRYELLVMLHTSSDPAGEAFSLGPVEVTSPPHQFDLPAGASVPTAPAQLEQGLTLAGYEIQLAGQSLKLNLYWQTQAPLTRRYKAFAQLLSADNALIAQSDSFPAAGQRPTTGWLPGEIITDPHTLTFATTPSPGSYRLIAGLYDPLTGQRLPLLDNQNQAVGDAIPVTEITLP